MKRLYTVELRRPMILPSGEAVPTIQVLMDFTPSMGETFRLLAEAVRGLGAVRSVELSWDFAEGEYP